MVIDFLKYHEHNWIICVDPNPNKSLNHRRLPGYNAGWFGTGLGSRVSNRDTNVHLDLTSWGY